jgi:hypothetical protein
MQTRGYSYDPSGIHLNLKNIVFWNTRSCSPVEVYVTTQPQIPEHNTGHNYFYEKRTHYKKPNNAKYYQCYILFIESVTK